jgi:conjugal transfer/entry exclusion protein
MTDEQARRVIEQLIFIANNLDGIKRELSSIDSTLRRRSR